MGRHQGLDLSYTLHLLSAAVFLVVTICATDTLAFLTPVTPVSLTPSSSRSFPKSSLLILAASSPQSSDDDGDGDSDAVLTDMDARVLQSMLQDQKLDLREETNMKKLLERGVKSKEPVKDVKQQQEEPDTDYSSQVLQTLGSTKLWKGLSRNAADWMESAKIWVENKVERDTKLVASLGIFAFDRALRDVQRALPATSTVVKTVAPKFLLTDTSSVKTTNDIRNQMTTPLDEIQSVTTELKSIFESGGDRRGGGGGGGDSGGGLSWSSQPNRALNSAASSKLGKDRFLKAYQRQKQTTLKRERENLAQASARMAGSVMDSAYQVKRELQVEPNQPGYKTKALREGAAQTSKFLASGAKGILSGAKKVAQSALPPNKQQQRGSPAALPTSSTKKDGGMAATAAAMNMAAATQRPNQPPMTSSSNITPPPSVIDAMVVDTSIVDRDVNQPPPSTTSGRRPTVADAPVNARIPWTSSQPTAGSPSNPLYDASPPPSAEATQEEELMFFASREATNFQQEQTIASLLDTQSPSTSEEAMGNPTLFSTEAADAAYVWGGDVDTGEAAAAALENIISEYVDVTPEIVKAVTETPRIQELYETDVLEEEYDDLLLDEDPIESLRKVMAEIVSDEDFEDAVGQAKQVDNTAGQEVAEEDEDKEPNIVTIAALRLLDVALLVFEKLILAIPSLLSMLPTIALRIATVQNDGLGSQGWRTISSAKRGDRRY